MTEFIVLNFGMTSRNLHSIYAVRMERIDPQPYSGFLFIITLSSMMDELTQMSQSPSPSYVVNPMDIYNPLYTLHVHI